MNTIFMNSRNSKISNPHRVLLNLTDKIDFKRKNRYIVLSNLTFTLNEKIQKSHMRRINLKYQLQSGIKNFNYLMDYLILYQI